MGGVRSFDNGEVAKIIETLDARGLNCPQPLIITKKALEKLRKAGQRGILQVLVSNEAAKINVSKFAEAQGCAVKVITEADRFLINIFIKESPFGVRNEDEQVLCYLITKNTMGSGNDELGAVLMRSFFYTLLEMESRPQKIFLINSGILLALMDSPVLKYLEELARQSVDILVCGTCIDFYDAKGRVAVGDVTNMYMIAEAMSSSQVKMVTI